MATSWQERGRSRAIRVVFGSLKVYPVQVSGRKFVDKNRVLTKSFLLDAFSDAIRQRGAIFHFSINRSTIEKVGRYEK